MHFKNGREAKEGDPVITKDYHGKVVAGVAINLRAGETCNCDVVVPVFGGTEKLTCQTVGNMVHAEDALKAVEEATAAHTTHS